MPQPFNDVRTAIERRLTDERFATEMDLYMRNLEKSAYIESDPPAEAAGFRSGRAADRLLLDPLEAQIEAAGTASEEPVADDEDADGSEAPPE